jgi:hypothetical protein
MRGENWRTFRGMRIFVLRNSRWLVIYPFHKKKNVKRDNLFDRINNISYPPEIYGLGIVKSSRKKSYHTG